MKITVISKEMGGDRIKEVNFGKELRSLKEGIKTILEISNLKKETVAQTSLRINSLLDTFEITCHPDEVRKTSY